MPYATWGRRAGAFLLDLSVLLTLCGTAYFGGDAIGGAAGVWFASAFYTAGLVVNFYNKCVRMGRTGQSWGKQAMGFGLLMDSNRRPMGWFRALVREFAHAADMVSLGVGWLFPLWDAKRQTLADKIMRTVPVNRPQQQTYAA